MHRHVLFLHGGGGHEDHAADAELVTELRAALGDTYEVHAPVLRDESSPDLGRLGQIHAELSSLPGATLVVAHSLGASMLLKYLSEAPSRHELAAVFLLATPFWHGDEDWKQGLKLRDDFATRLPANLAVFLYHCRDDDAVPFEHLARYRQQLPEATVRELARGGHQLDGAVAVVVADLHEVARAHPGRSPR